MKLHHAQQKIQRILRDNLYERRALARSGDVEFLRLAHYKTSRQLFSRKISESGKHYNFTLLLDMSGSMSGSEARRAIESCQNIVKLLKGIVNIKISVFNNIHFENIDQDELLSLKTSGEIHDYYERKYMDVPVAYDTDENGKKHLRKFVRGEDKDVFTHAAFGNVETINIEYEYKKLKQLDGRNVMIVLQDGNINRDTRIRKGQGRSLLGKDIVKYEDEDFAKRLYKKISRDIELVSIGIGTNEPEEFFDNFAYVSNAEKIYEVVVKIFERLID